MAEERWPERGYHGRSWCHKVTVDRAKSRMVWLPTASVFIATLPDGGPMGASTLRPQQNRRTLNGKFKQHVLTECAEPGVSVAGAAVSHGINANLVKTRRRESRKTSDPRLPSPPPPATPRTRALRRAPTHRRASDFG